jgi:polar amino acid transport system permease protein
METIAQSFFNAAAIERYWFYLLNGLGQTLFLAALAIPLGVLFGALFCVFETQTNMWIRLPIAIYVDLLRSFPPLALLIFIGAALLHLGLRSPPFGFDHRPSAPQFVVLFWGNHSSRPVRRPPGIASAARATGMSYLQTIWYFRLPLAIRNVMPDLLSNTLELVKLTSIAVAVTYVKPTQGARIIKASPSMPHPLLSRQRCIAPYCGSLPVSSAGSNTARLRIAACLT